MPFPTDEELFKCVGCPCCFEGFACSPFGNCCAIRLESIFECDPVGSKNCFFDQRIQQCCVNDVMVCPIAAEKVKPEVALCGQQLVNCVTLACPTLCFSTCVPPTGDMFPAADKVCCKTHCYCCVSGYYCVFPQCLSGRAKGTCNCAPFAAPSEPLSVEVSSQVCFNYARVALPLSDEIPSKIGCCDIVCWSNPNHPATQPVPQSEESASSEVTVQVSSAV